MADVSIWLRNLGTRRVSEQVLAGTPKKSTIINYEGLQIGVLEDYAPSDEQ